MYVFSYSRSESKWYKDEGESKTGKHKDKCETNLAEDQEESEEFKVTRQGRTETKTYEYILTINCILASRHGSRK